MHSPGAALFRAVDLDGGSEKTVDKCQRGISGDDFNAAGRGVWHFHILQWREAEDASLSGAINEGFQGREKCGVGDGGALAAADERVSASAEGRDAEGHGDAMIVEGIEFGAV